MYSISMSDEKTQHAVVLSGGANAPYEVGVLKALLTRECHHVEGSPIDPEIYTGLSLGALNAAVMGSRADRATRFLRSRRLSPERYSLSVLSAFGLWGLR